MVQNIVPVRYDTVSYCTEKLAVHYNCGEEALLIKGGSEVLRTIERKKEIPYKEGHVKAINSS